MELSSSEEQELQLQELIERFMKGEHEVFEELYALIKPRILGYLRGRYGTQDKEVLDDILQMTYEHLPRGLAKYDRSKGKFCPFARGIAKKQAGEYYRQQNRQGWGRVI
jgi:DNA-directed RNA polymerase specialized sigma24 family protein